MAGTAATGSPISVSTMLRSSRGRPETGGRLVAAVVYIGVRITGRILGQAVITALALIIAMRLMGVHVQ